MTEESIQRRVNDNPDSIEIERYIRREVFILGYDILKDSRTY